MIRLFRGLKSNLLKEGRLSKYLLYALGEILLVVIGIIIAVQINTLIENSNRHKLQVRILTEIQKNLSVDLTEINDEVDNYGLMLLYDSMLLTAAQQRLPFSDLLAAYAFTLETNSHMNATLSGYQLLQSKGIDLITDDSLRIALTDLYERRYTYYKKYETERIEIVQSTILPYMIKNFYQVNDTTFWAGRKRIPMNFEALMKNPEWVSIIQTNEGLAAVLVGKAKDLKQRIQAMHDRIDSYLKKQ